MSRITLITHFEDQELNKIEFLLKDIDYDMCKVPFGIDNNRNKLDNLPYHITIFATDKDNQKKFIDIIKNIDLKRIALKVDKVQIMNGRNNSYVLYLGIETNNDLKNLQRIFYKEFPYEHYNPDEFEFHITLHIDKDYNKILDLRNEILAKFEPFTLEFSNIDLYDYPGDKIDWRDKQ